MFLPSEIEDIKKTMSEIMKEVRKNEALMVRMAEYDKYLDTLNEVSKGTRVKNTAVGFMAMLEIIKNHMEELKEVWIDDAKDKEYVPISTIIGRSDIKAKAGRILDKAVKLLIDKREIKKADKEDAIVVLAEKYLESQGKISKEKKEK